MSQLADLLKGYISTETLYYNIIRKNRLFYAKYNINLDANFYTSLEKEKLNQFGGDIFSTKIKDINYSFEYYKIHDFADSNGTNFINGIIIKRKNTLDNISYSSSKHCALLLFNNKDLLKIAFLNMHSDCYDLVDKNNLVNKDNLANKNGSTLLKLIMLWAKNQTFKRIVLSDQVQFTCKENSYLMSYELKYIHTLTHGSTWYGKYGFKFVNNLDNDALIYNKNFLDNFKTKDYPFELLIKIIMYEIVDQKVYAFMDKYDYLLNINKIIKLYDEYKDKLFYKFMKIISREFCFLVSHIYMKIFESLKLKKYIDSEMEFVFNYDNNQITK